MPSRRKRRRSGEIAVGTSPEGHALKFVHRGSYDGLDNTYEAITNYLDDHKRLEAKDMFIEQYVTDPLTTNEDHLVVNVYRHDQVSAHGCSSAAGAAVPLLELKHLPRAQRTETLGRNFRDPQRIGQRDEAAHRSARR